MIFSYSWLQSYIKEKLPRPEKLAELLAEHFFPVEEIRKKGKDFVLDIDVKPNRAGDCFSHIGIAREISAITRYPLLVTRYSAKEDKHLKAKDFVKVEVKDKTACPRYTARVITDAKVGSSPKWMKQRLETCGLQSINNIVDIANYVMLETGQPLHAFDLEKLEGRKLIVRFAKKREKIITLDDKKFDLDETVLVIADEKNPVAIAGIKGGKSPAIDNKTKIVVLESANFGPRTIRKGSKFLSLKTDASWRFEHGIDPNLTEIAINRAAQLIQEIAEGKIADGSVDFYPRKIISKKVRLDISKVESLLGIKISQDRIVKILKSLEFKVKSLRSKILEVEVPTFRLDVSIPEDLIEEVGRIYGYKKIPIVLPKAVVMPPERNLEIFWEEFSKDALKENGFDEVYNYSFIGEESRKLFGYKKQELVELENPMSKNQQYLAPSLVPNLLKNVQDNFRYLDEIKIFELGKVFRNSGIESRKSEILEKRALTGLIARKQRKEGFYELKGMIDSLLKKTGISDFYCDEYQPTPEESKIVIWNTGKCAEVKLGDKEVGFLGEISLKILKALKIKGEVVLFDIDFEELQALSSEEHEFKPFSPYPAAIRDLAILVPSEIKVVDVLNIIEREGENMIRDVDLFDIYEGEELPEGKKNFAFHIIYQAEDRTLTAQEIDKVHKKIEEALEENLEWEIRK